MDHLLEFEADDTVLESRDAASIYNMQDIDAYMDGRDCHKRSTSTDIWVQGAMDALSNVLFQGDVHMFLQYWKEPIRKSDQIESKVDSSKNKALESYQSLDSMISMSLPMRSARLKEAKTEILIYLREYKNYLISFVDDFNARLEEYVNLVRQFVKRTYIPQHVKQSVTDELHQVVDTHVKNSDIRIEWIAVVHDVIDEESRYCVDKSKETIQQFIRETHNNIFASMNREPPPSINLVKWNSPQIDIMLKASMQYIDMNVIAMCFKVLSRYDKYVGNVEFYDLMM